MTGQIKDTRPPREKVYEMTVLIGAYIFSCGVFMKEPALIIPGLALLVISPIIHSWWDFHHPIPPAVPPTSG